MTPLINDNDMNADKNCKDMDVKLKPWRMAALATLILMAVVALMMIPKPSAAAGAWAVGLLASKAAAGAGLWAAWRLARCWGMVPATA